MAYEVWDLDSGNRLGEYATEVEALAEIRHALDTYGREYASTLLLDVEDDDGHTRLIAEGAELIALAIGTRPNGNGTGEAPEPTDRHLNSGLRPKMPPRRSRTKPPTR